MSTLQVVHWPHPALAAKAEPVTVFDDELKAFARELEALRLRENGIGLAATQVGVMKRVVAIGIPYSERYDKVRFWWHDQKFLLVNPEIVARRGKTKCLEGCLSFPDIYEYIERSAEVTVRAQDIDGKPVEIEADDYLAYCFQHEIDHLDGVVFLNRMSRMKASMVRRKLQKRGPIDAGV